MLGIFMGGETFLFLPLRQDLGGRLGDMRVLIPPPICRRCSRRCAVKAFGL